MRRFWISVSAIAAAAGLAAGSPASAATTLDVNWNTGCGKSNCFNDQGVFTQTWSSTGAHGPMTIGQFLLDRGILGDLDGKTFSITFSIGGHEIGTWGKYNMAGIGGDELHFTGEDFVWNPADGDLVLTLAILPPPKAGGGGALFAPLSNEPGPPAGGPQDNPDPNQGFFGGDDSQLITGGGVDVGGVPEPASWALMIGGFGLAGATLRRRRALTA